MAVKQQETGFALMIVLWVVAIMGTFTMLYSSQVRLSMKINHNSQESQRAQLLAEAGLQRFIAELVQDLETTVSDHKNETWHNSNTLFFDVAMGEGIYRLTHTGTDEEQTTYYGGVDECSKLNINTASRIMLLMLPNATEEIVDAIIDWRDEDDEPQTFGAESPYYMSLAEPYMAKNSQFDTIDELLILKGMTLDILYGEDTNLNGTLDVNENDGNESYPVDNSDGVLDRGWFPYICVYSYEPNISSTGTERININDADEEELQEEFGETLDNQDIRDIVQGQEDDGFETIAHVLDSGLDVNKWLQIVDRITVSDEEKLFGRINLNTAPDTVLRCVFSEPTDEPLIQSIIQYRENNTTGFENVGQLLNVEGMNEDRLQEVINQFCTKSAVFSARSIGYLERSGAYKKIFAIVDRGDEYPKIMYWKEDR